MSDNTNWLKPWRTIDILQLCKTIAGRSDIYYHPVGKEWEYYIEERAKGNDRAIIECIGSDDKTPLINAYLLANGFTKNETVLYWVCW